MGGKTKRKTFAAGVETATGGEVRRFRPSHVIAKHSTNQRFAPYDAPEEISSFIGDKCCFTLAQIERRLASFKAEGQIDAVKVSMSGTCHPELEVGFLRHCAFLLAEVRGEIDQIPGAKGTKVSGLRAELVKAPGGKNAQAMHAARARRNYAENNERKDLSPVDRAIYFKRQLAALNDDGEQLTKPQLAAELECSVDHINKHLRLFTCLNPDELLAVHEGRLKMAPALKAASKRGSGGTPGPRGERTNVRHSHMSRALKLAQTRPAPPDELVPAQTVQLAAIIAGDMTIHDCKDKSVIAWATWLNADKSCEPAKEPRQRKKAPPHKEPKADTPQEC